MKKHSLTLEIIIFSAVFALCITPGIITQFLPIASQAFSSWDFPFSALLSCALAGVICFFFYEMHKPEDGKQILFKYVLPATFCFCILFCISCIFKFFALTFPVNTNNELEVTMPSGFLEWFYSILMFIFAAFYEEVIYRFYVPETVMSWINGKTQKKIWKYLAEFGFMAVFAAGHIYLGFYAVFVAVFAHFVLRFFYKKTGSIIPGFIAHAVYNIISLILL